MRCRMRKSWVRVSAAWIDRKDWILEMCRKSLQDLDTDWMWKLKRTELTVSLPNLIKKPASDNILMTLASPQIGRIVNSETHSPPAFPPLIHFFPTPHPTAPAFFPHSLCFYLNDNIKIKNSFLPHWFQWHYPGCSLTGMRSRSESAYIFSM